MAARTRRGAHALRERGYGWREGPTLCASVATGGASGAALLVFLVLIVVHTGGPFRIWFLAATHRAP